MGRRLIRALGAAVIVAASLLSAHADVGPSLSSAVAPTTGTTLSWRWLGRRQVGWGVAVVLLALGGWAVLGPSPAPAAPAQADVCAPRPPVGVATVPSGPDRLQVTITASASPALPDNRLQTLRFSAATNALVDVPGGPPGAAGGFTVALPATTQQVQFIVRQRTPGESLMVPLVVVDLCGDWPTFVGGGPSAFPTYTASALSPTAPPVGRTPTPAGLTPTVAVPTPTVAVPTPIPGPSGQVRLVERYALKGSNTQDVTAYRPAQFTTGLALTDESWGPWTVTNAGAYAGWDLLALPDRDDHRSNADPAYATIRLTRPATLAVIWRDSERPGGTPPPSWLGGWTQTGTVTTSGQFAGTHRVYRKSFPAGDAVLPGPANGNSGNLCCGVDNYWLLFAESTGQPSPAPGVPAGQPVPQANQTCPQWVHDQYVTGGPDGRSYPTWHAQIDPVYWCYFRHEHGSNPAAFDPSWHPAFGYATTQAGEAEAHPGFKVYVLDDAGWNGYRWAFVHHFGTGNAATAACVRFHELQAAVKRLASNQIVARLAWTADFGPGLNPSGGDLTPSACPQQGPQARADGSQGSRLLPVPGDPGFAFYEPWAADLARNGVLGWTFTSLSRTLAFNTPDFISQCVGNTCDQTSSVPGNTGSRRFLTYSNGALVASGASSGTFYTDPRGRQVVAAGTAGAVQQYLEPGLTVPLRPRADDETCEDWYAWGQPYVCASLAVHNTRDIQPTQREASLRNPN
jgi:hypothetical protein